MNLLELRTTERMVNYKKCKRSSTGGHQSFDQFIRKIQLIVPIPYDRIQTLNTLQKVSLVKFIKLFELMDISGQL